MPALLHEGDKEVDGHGEVLSDLLLGLLDVADGGSEAGGLLGLELDGMLDFINLISELFSFSQCDGELSELDQDVAQKFGNLLGDGVGGEKDVVLLAPFLYFCLIFVESFQSIDINVGDVIGSGFFNVSGISQNANLY